MNERRIALMRILDSRKKYTARELAERFGVSVRTIQRDLDYLQQTGLPLYTETGPHGGYRALPNRLLPPLHLARDEAFGLFLMLQLLENIPDIPFGAVREHLSEHYYAELPQDVRDSIDQFKDYIAFRMMPTHAESPYTSLILEAALNKRRLNMLYRSASGDKWTKVYPVGLYFDHGYWYMPAQSRDRIILYRSDRVMTMTILEDTLSGLPTLKEWLTAEDSRTGIPSKIEFTPLGARLAESDPLFQNVSHEKSRGQEWYGHIPVEEFKYVSRLLLKYGPEAEVIYPKELRMQVKRLLQDSLNPYLKDDEADQEG
ncbi:helix-turn-helix transcriptional regulator [Paenibacillus polymyxa]|uniref:helix-turn-helix transcriptional regulator n=1 Tax=Paenibacillus polymyxa TaxID=1406 RepID=UPI0025B71F5A|nr:YafY family protein [Paenibacillus polymyxa]MDN4084475.1 YafY family protein [Paenibacillus polymyxa]MDN4090106.1 YafY family protein [Paenibacillus polymyxa]MDN4110891.1 YafY family protein [Paenibacillus polymyxa]